MLRAVCVDRRSQLRTHYGPKTGKKPTNAHALRSVVACAVGDGPRESPARSAHVSVLSSPSSTRQSPLRGPALESTSARHPPAAAASWPRGCDERRVGALLAVCVACCDKRGVERMRGRRLRSLRALVGLLHGDMGEAGARKAQAHAAAPPWTEAVPLLGACGCARRAMARRATHALTTVGRCRECVAGDRARLRGAVATSAVSAATARAARHAHAVRVVAPDAACVAHCAAEHGGAGGCGALPGQGV